MKKNIIKKTLFVLALSGLILTATACKKDSEAADNTSQESMEAEITEQAENASTEREVSDGTTESRTQRESTEEPAEVSDNEVTTQTETGTNKAADNSDRPTAANNQSSAAKNTQTDNTPIADASQAFDTTTSNNTTQNNPAQHTHTWVAVTETVNHPEEGHYESVCVDPGATWPKYELHTLCHGCGFDYTATQTPVDKHVCSDGIRYTYGGQQVQVGETVIPPRYEDQLIVDKSAWTETVTTGHRCSTCGETK